MAVGCSDPARLHHATSRLSPSSSDTRALNPSKRSALAVSASLRETGFTLRAGPYCRLPATTHNPAQRSSEFVQAGFRAACHIENFVSDCSLLPPTHSPERCLR